MKTFNHGAHRVHRDFLEVFSVSSVVSVVKYFGKPTKLATSGFSRNPASICTLRGFRSSLTRWSTDYDNCSTSAISFVLPLALLFFFRFSKSITLTSMPSNLSTILV